MTIPQQIAKHLREVYNGGNWTAVNMKDTLSGITWQQATTKIHNLNTVAALVFHINYYISAVLKVLEGQPLKASDKYSFDLPSINSEEDWQKLIAKSFAEAEQVANLIEKLDEKILDVQFQDPKYGNYYRNLAGLIEHAYYHMGQIMLQKKIMNE
jgi:hypothetical protein